MSPSRSVSAVAACLAMAGASTVAVSNFLLGFSVSVFLGKPGGGFEPAVRYRTGGQADYVGIEDFNEDHHIDLVTSDQEPTMSVLIIALPSSPCRGLQVPQPAPGGARV
ncbi:MULTISPECIES: hypothetical protein [Streptosporangium]|uniref:VCBS repeat-containing protein n=1 Tax=Streptosporangium brasiliense TaxID=47480 RepID=A0ABT9R400_9ACTN|nr:hypothetical protein [Streptosporangium brasiliense]MDP9863903.1 hypothetical protein [Streptosporangium brasiliense]